MYTVGLDVDTRVSLIGVILLIMIRLFAGTLKKSPLIFIVVGTIFFYYIRVLNLDTSCINFWGSADNPLFSLYLANPLTMIRNLRNQVNKDPDNLFDGFPKEIQISDHLKYKKPESDKEFGEYMARLIDRESTIEYKKDRPVLVLPFLEKNTSSAFFIKKKLGYGRVIKNDNGARRYILEHKDGMAKITNLIYNKLVSKKKLFKSKDRNESSLPRENSDIFSNYWLTGYLDSDVDFSISIEKGLSGNNIYFSLSFVSDDCKTHQYIKDKINFESRKEASRLCRNKYKLYTSNLYCLYTIIDYLDKHPFLNHKTYLNYFWWRRAYRIAQRGEHNEDKGLLKIKRIMDNLRD